MENPDTLCVCNVFYVQTIPKNFRYNLVNYVKYIFYILYKHSNIIGFFTINLKLIQILKKIIFFM